MRFIYAEYNMYHNSVDVTTFDGYILRIDCNVEEDGLRTTPCYECGEMRRIAWNCSKIR